MEGRKIPFSLSGKMRRRAGRLFVSNAVRNGFVCTWVEEWHWEACNKACLLIRKLFPVFPCRLGVR